MRTKVKQWIVICVAVFLVINLIWYSNYQRYRSITKGYKKSPVNYYLAEDNYSLSISPPKYLRLQGSLSITDNRYLTVVYWPKTFLLARQKCGVVIADEKNNTTFLFYVDDKSHYQEDESIQYTNDEMKKINYLEKKNKRKLKCLDHIAKKEWAKILK